MFTHRNGHMLAPNLSQELKDTKRKKMATFVENAASQVGNGLNALSADDVDTVLVSTHLTKSTSHESTD